MRATIFYRIKFIIIKFILKNLSAVVTCWPLSRISYAFFEMLKKYRQGGDIYWANLKGHVALNLFNMRNFIFKCKLNDLTEKIIFLFLIKT